MRPTTSSTPADPRPGDIVRWQAFHVHAFDMEVLEVAGAGATKRLLVRPVAGSGEAWVAAHKCTTAP